MPVVQLDLGKASFSQPKARIQVSAQASVDVSIDGSCLKGTDFSLTSFIDSVPWTKAKQCFSVNVFFSFADESSFSSNSRRAFLKQLGRTLSGAELWSQLRLSANADVLCDDLRTEVQAPATLRLDICQQHPTHTDQPEPPYNLSDPSHDIGNVKPPSGVQIVLLCMVNISLAFSCLGSTALVPRKRCHSESEDFLDPIDGPVIPRSGMLRLADHDRAMSCDRQQEWAVSQSLLTEETNFTLNDTNLVLPLLLNYANPEGGSGGAPEDVNDDTESLVFSSQGSTILQSQDASVGKACELHPSLHVPSMLVLTDAAFRNLICQKPIRTAPGIRTDTTKLGARLSDIAPLTFSPGYAQNLGARSSLVPTIARFLTSFLQKAKSVPLIAQRDATIRQFSKMQSAEHLDGPEVRYEEETKLKEAIKTHLWKTMANGLQNPEPARRLKSLLATDRPRRDELLHSESCDGEICNFLDGLDHETSTGDHYAWAGPSPVNSDNDDQLLDFYEDDEADDYDFDLCEVYEERLLRTGRRHFSDLESETNESDHPVEERIAVHSPTDDLLFSMLEMQECPDPKPAQQLASTPATARHVPSPPATASTDATALIKISDRDDDSWPDLLDEEPHPKSNAHTEDAHVSSQSSTLEDDWEPAFEQWEFDVEQGYDEMLV